MAGGELTVVGDLDPEQLAAALDVEAAFLRPVGTLEQLGSGFNSHVFATQSGWIVRVARTVGAAQRHAHEMLVLPLISPALLVPVPRPRVALHSCAVAPYGASSYRRLPGRVMAEGDAAVGVWGRIADGLGAALASLHAIPLAQTESLSLRHIGTDHLLEIREDTSSALSASLKPAEWEQVDAWWQALLRGEFARSSAVAITHRDPWWENLTVDDDGLAGILDWEFVALSDPANDLGVVLQMGENFFVRTLAAYSARSTRRDPTLEARSRDRRATLEFYGIRTAIERGDEAELLDSLRKLRAGPVLGPK